jgi:septal ring factor EnvC (AmiA/AmiB activator)
MSIKRVETQLARLDTKIRACQTQLTELKRQRTELKTALIEAKKAAKQGQPIPETTGAAGLAERIGIALNENVFEPIADLISPPAEKPAT